MLANASRTRSIVRRRLRPRRGVTLWHALVWLGLALTVLAIVVDLGRLSLCRQRMQFAADAAAIAAAGELFDHSVLTPGAAGQDFSLDDYSSLQLAAAKSQAQFYLDRNLATGGLLGVTAKPEMQVAVGKLNHGRFEPGEALGQAVEVRLAFSNQHGNPFPLYLTRWFGGDNAGVGATAVATLQQGLVGFRPSAQAFVPCMPILLACDGGPQSWYDQAVQPTSAVFNDRFSVSPLDSLVIANQGDGIPELVFRIQLQSNNANSERASGWLVRWGDASPQPAERLQQQIETGLSPDDLVAYGGQVLFDNAGQITVMREQVAAASAAELAEAIRAHRGEAKIWPLGLAADKGQDSQILQFAAGQVVDCQATEDGALTLLVQPCVMQTDTALMDPAAAANPWIGRLAIAR